MSKVENEWLESVNVGKCLFPIEVFLNNGISMQSKKILRIPVIVCFLSILVLNEANAQHIPNIPSSAGSGGGSYEPLTTEYNIKDPGYIRGREAFIGDDENNRIQFCVLPVDEDKQPVSIAQAMDFFKLSKKSLRPYKNAEAVTLARALINCEAPKEYALKKITKPERIYVIYYLNKRYRLNLKE